MRILVITLDFPSPGHPEGGIVVLRQAQALVALGHQLSVARLVPHAPNWTAKWRAYRSVPDRYEVEGIEVDTLRAFFPPRMIGVEYLPLQLTRAIRATIARRSPDVLHAQYLIPSGQVAVGLGVPSVVTAHGSDAYDWPWRRSGLRRAARYAVQKASCVVGVSNFIRERVRALHDRVVHVVYNGADERIFTPADRNEARAELGIPSDRFVIAFSGRLSRDKGAFDLIKAAERLGEQRPILLFCGPAAAETFAMAARSAQIDIRILGMLEHRVLARVLAAANVFCLPSYREGLPLALCEAMLCGLPVVATPVGGIPEVVTEGVSGYLAPPGDIERLAARLRLLAEDAQLAGRMGSAARRFASSELTWTTNARRYDEIYRSMRDAAPAANSR